MMKHKTSKSGSIRGGDLIPAGLGATLSVAKPKDGSFLDGMLWDLQAVKGERIVASSRIIGFDLNPNILELAKKFRVTICKPKSCKNQVQEVIAKKSNGVVYRSVDCTDIGMSII